MRGIYAGLETVESMLAKGFKRDGLETRMINGVAKRLRKFRCGKEVVLIPPLEAKAKSN